MEQQLLMQLLASLNQNNNLLSQILSVLKGIESNKKQPQIMIQNDASRSSVNAYDRSAITAEDIAGGDKRIGRDAIKSDKDTSVAYEPQ